MTLANMKSQWKHHDKPRARRSDYLLPGDKSGDLAPMLSTLPVETEEVEAVPRGGARYADPVVRLDTDVAPQTDGAHDASAVVDSPKALRKGWRRSKRGRRSTSSSLSKKKKASNPRSKEAGSSGNSGNNNTPATSAPPTPIKSRRGRSPSVFTPPLPPKYIDSLLLGLPKERAEDEAPPSSDSESDTSVGRTCHTTLLIHLLTMGTDLCVLFRSISPAFASVERAPQGTRPRQFTAKHARQGRLSTTWASLGAPSLWPHVPQARQPLATRALKVPQRQGQGHPLTKGRKAQHAWPLPGGGGGKAGSHGSIRP